MASQRKPGGISWCEETWNAARGCTRVDQGCVNCYAESVAHRFGGEGQPYEGLTVVQPNGEPRWNGKVTLVEKHLLDPLRWQKPRKIFVNSMSDFFHPAIPDEWRDKQMAVMALVPQHIFQVLTKREDEMFKYLKSKGRVENIRTAMRELNVDVSTRKRQERWFQTHEKLILPLPNLWLLVSVNDQASADKRIPMLLRTPAAIRGISYEPATGPLDLRPRPARDMCLYEHPHAGPCKRDGGLDWVIIGGESGPNARPLNIQWARDIIAQCQLAEVAVYMKQLGAHPYISEAEWHKRFKGIARWLGPDMIEYPMLTGKGDDPAEWFEDLRVQEYPNGAGAGNP